MTQPAKPSTALWIAQTLLAIFMLMGAYMKFQPIEQLSAMMPWTGEVPEWVVRTLGCLDMFGAIGLMLPATFKMKQELTFWAAIGVGALMVLASIFHVVRGEASVIGANIMALAFAAYIAWGWRPKK